MKLIYVASPYAGDVEQNVERAREYCRYVIDQGCVPIASHLLYPQILDDNIPVERELGTHLGIELLTRCDELWAFGDRMSPGMEAEITEAQRLDIPVQQIPETTEEMTAEIKYGVIACRSAASICGKATAWLKNNGKPMEFDSYAQAAIEADRLNRSCRSSNVSYYPKQMPAIEETQSMGLHL